MSERIVMGGVEDRNIKRKLEQSAFIADDEDFGNSLSLGLSTNFHGQTSWSERPPQLHSFMASAENQEESGSDAGEEPPQKKREFPCKFCNKFFTSSQALGGHQNAHRRERVLSKINKELNMGTFKHLAGHLCPYSAIAAAAATVPYTIGNCDYGSPRAPSMQTMPPQVSPTPMSWPRIGHGYGASPTGLVTNLPLQSNQTGVTGGSWEAAGVTGGSWEAADIGYQQQQPFINGTNFGIGGGFGNSSLASGYPAAADGGSGARGVAGGAFGASAAANGVVAGCLDSTGSSSAVGGLFGLEGDSGFTANYRPSSSGFNVSLDL